MPALPILVVIALAWMAVGCTDASDELRKPLVNLDSIIHSGLNGTKSIRKTVWLGKDSASAEYACTDMARETEAFGILSEINKPVYRDTFDDTLQPDAGSNLQVRMLTSLDSAAPIRKLRIYFRPESGTILRMDAHFRRENILFRKEEWFEFNYDPDGVHLSSVHIRGEQKILGMDPDFYETRMAYIRQ